MEFSLDFNLRPNMIIMMEYISWYHTMNKIGEILQLCYFSLKIETQIFAFLPGSILESFLRPSFFKNIPMKLYEKLHDEAAMSEKVS